MAKEMTTEEICAELKITKELFEMWERAMQELWTSNIEFCIYWRIFPVQKDNVIYVYKKNDDIIKVHAGEEAKGWLYSIKINFVNHSYLELELTYRRPNGKDRELASIRVDNNILTVVKCVRLIMFAHYNSL